jgi:RNA polymerase sigma factor (sigma-70 family)
VSDALPVELTRLLAAPSEPAEDAWAEFVRAHSRLLLHVARSMAGDRDAAMEYYAYVLEQLRRDGCRRLRGYTPGGAGKFTTWLVVVTRRLCLDFHRHRYGRTSRAQNPAGGDAPRAERRRLRDLVSATVEVASLSDVEAADAEAAVRTHDLAAALDRALATLDPADRLLLRLRFDDGLPAAEIARLTGAPTPFHVYRRIDRLLTRLRKVLEASGYHEASP